VYGYFGDKEGLFREVIRSTIAPLQDSLQEQIDQAAGGDARTSLRELIHRLATIVITPQVVRLRRLVIAETDRFPDLAAEWYRLGPEQTVARLTAYLEDLNRSGELRIDDLAGAAEQLLWLSVSAPLNRLMFAPSGAIPRRGELRRNGDAALETFWRAYATNP
jgi:TetR/AcrR family transcriptional repressor of mexJK operon